MSRRRFANMYLTTTISVMLVLLLIGLESIVLLSAEQLFRQVKQNMVLDVVVDREADSTMIKQLDTYFNVVPYCHEYHYISSDQALQDHISSLGDDPTRFLGYNPLSASFEVHLDAQYAYIDSIEPIVAHLEQMPMVDQVVYQRDLLELMNENISRVTLVLLAAALVLLLIALMLIINTVRLQIYSKRFIIATMALVGATSWHIRRPFVARYAGIGTAAAILAFGVLAAVVYYAQVRYGVMLFSLAWQNIAFVAGVLFISGNLITLFAALFATGKYIRMKNDTLYEI